MGFSTHPKETDSVPLVSEILLVFLIYFVFLFFLLLLLFHFFFTFCQSGSIKDIISQFSLLILQLMEIWRTVTNIAVAVTPLCPYLYLSDIITNARNILADKCYRSELFGCVFVPIPFHE